MKFCSWRGGYFSSSRPWAFARRLMSDCWSPESRIWKSCGRSASRKCVRSSRLHSPWKVPTHMPRVLIGSIADSRVSISRAALLVKVTARMPPGLACPDSMRWAMRVVSTRVLPLPAPARMRADSRGRVTAWCCWGLRPETRRDMRTEAWYQPVIISREIPKKEGALAAPFNCLPQLLVTRSSRDLQSTTAPDRKFPSRRTFVRRGQLRPRQRADGGNQSAGGGLAGEPRHLHDEIAVLRNDLA